MIIQIGTDVDESRILWKHNENDDWERADIDDLIDAYESEHKTGEWERFSFPDGDVMECTNCGYRDWADVWEEESRNYCPNCGADMRGDEE